MPELTIRSAGPCDLPLIADLYARLSSSCFAERFMSPRAGGSLERLARFDPANDVVLLVTFADAPDVPIAEARYVPTGPTSPSSASSSSTPSRGRASGRPCSARCSRRPASAG